MRFQNLGDVNPPIFSFIQDIWDCYRLNTRYSLFVQALKG